MSQRALVLIFSLVAVVYGSVGMAAPSAEGAMWSGYAAFLSARYAYLTWKEDQQ